MGKGDNEEANSMKKFWDYQEMCAKINMQVQYLDRMFININLGYYMFFNLAPNIYVCVCVCLCVCVCVCVYVCMYVCSVKVLKSSFQVLSDALLLSPLIFL